jgi:microcystin degradation protein MlrC
MRHTAIELAQAYWDARNDFAFGSKTGTIDDCVGWAVASGTHPIVLADSGDNPTAGGVGDRADVLRALIAANAQGVVLAGIADRPATEAAYAAGVGAMTTTDIGATLDPAGSSPVAVEGRVKFLLDAANPVDREAVLAIGGIDLVVANKRRPYHNIEDFTRIGLDPRTAKIVVVKSGYLSPELAPIANPSLMALSPGVVDQYTERLPRHRYPHPIYPNQRDFTYTPQPVWSARSR